ncbi:OsmC family protein [Actinomycetospora straminea]|uniref:OsmC-like protein n=1 Tax=Actinomycetospora straminea TaxID=663607 RepID=A0ABP9DUL2_9PSEU|nr:OsmC family protein [Actinomycetospora straminea]MDD7932413.1 OsmC family protein [Actinomycetospora straminea]
MDAPTVWARGHLADGDGRVVHVDVNGLPVACTVPADDDVPEGATSYGLLAASLSSCTAMSVRTFLQRWECDGSDVEVDVAFESSSPPVMHRRVRLTAPLDEDARRQLASVVDSTPVTILLRDALVIVTQLDVRTP